jgi:hypothetical protein
VIAEDHQEEKMVERSLHVGDGYDGRRDEDASGFLVNDHRYDQEDHEFISGVQECPLWDAVSIFQGSICQLETISYVM